jgi:hypothetical protein
MRHISELTTLQGYILELLGFSASLYPWLVKDWQAIYLAIWESDGKVFERGVVLPIELEK